MRRIIVVGVDGSPASRAALQWAVDYAGISGVALQAVIAWHYPSTGMWGIDADFESFAHGALEEALKPVVDAHPEMDIESCVVEGPAAQVLLDVARTAELLVVGSRGHGAFAGMLLGSVSTHCVHHARCPVVVVPGEER